VILRLDDDVACLTIQPSEERLVAAIHHYRRSFLRHHGRNALQGVIQQRASAARIAELPGFFLIRGRTTQGADFPRVSAGQDESVASILMLRH